MHKGMGYFHKEVGLKMKGSAGELTQLWADVNCPLKFLAMIILGLISHNPSLDTCSHAQPTHESCEGKLSSPLLTQTPEDLAVPGRQIILFPEQRPYFATRCYSSQSSSKKQHDVFYNYLIDPVAVVPFPCVALYLLLKWKALQRPQNWGMTGIQNQMCLDKDWRKSDEGNTDSSRKK